MFQTTDGHIQAVHILENNSFILWQDTVFARLRSRSVH